MASRLVLAYMTGVLARFSLDGLDASAVADLASVMDQGFEQIVQDTIAQMSVSGPEAVLDLVRGTLVTRSQMWRSALTRGFLGDWSEYEDFTRARARAYVAAGVQLADWVNTRGSFVSAVAARLVADFGGDPRRLGDAMQALNSFMLGTIALFGTEFIAAKESDLRSSRARIAAILDAAFDGVVTVDERGTVLDLNGAAERLFGRPSEHAVGRSVSELVGSASAGAYHDPLLALPLAAAPGPARPYDTSARGPDGVELDVEIAIARVEHPGPAIFTWTIRDVTAARRVSAEIEARRADAVSAAAKLAVSEAALRALASRREAEREHERTRIAREIHDELGQELTALKLEVESLASDASVGGPPAAWVPRLARLAENLGATMMSVRRIATELRPSVLDDLGLVPAIRWHANVFAQRTGIVVSLDLQEEVSDVGGERATALFRIAQELLTNVARHAEARRVVMRLHATASEIALSVQDDGRGIAEADAEDPRSLGLLGIRERLAPFGGSLSIRRSAVCGTAAEVRLPHGGGRR